MSFLDTLSNLNPFKKKEEFSFAPLNQELTHETNPQFEPSFSQEPLNDPRMTMPLGENIRQQKMSSIYEQEEHHDPYLRNNLQKDLELISAKLDYLKASLDAINQRLVNLEHASRQQQYENKRW